MAFRSFNKSEYKCLMLMFSIRWLKYIFDKKVALRAFISGSAACFLTACIAGALIPGANISTSAFD